MKNMPYNNRSAFSLVEVTVSLGVMAFALVAMFGLVPVGLTANQNSVEMNTMAAISQDIIADLHSTKTDTNRSPRFQFDTSGGTSPQVLFFNSSGEASGAVGAGPDLNASGSAGGSGSGSIAKTSRYRAAVVITATDSSDFAAKKVRIVVSRPAAADPGTNGWPTNSAGAFEAFSAITTN